VNPDLEHLKLLSIFHYVLAGMTALMACIPIIHLVIGGLMAFGTFDGTDGPPRIVGALIMAFAGLFIVAGWALSAMMVLVGRSLAARTRYTLCLVVAGVECIMMPFGTVLGVFTLVVLLRPSVAELFGRPVHGT
jgi:hypothetical protein